MYCFRSLVMLSFMRSALLLIAANCVLTSFFKSRNSSSNLLRRSSGCCALELVIGVIGVIGINARARADRLAADPDAAEAGYTALHAAVLRSQVQLVQALLLHDADVDAPLNHGTPGRRFSADYSLRYQLIGANAFWLAAKYGELDIIRLLAAGGADPLAVPESGMSALQAAMGIPQGTENRRNRVVSAYQPGPDKNNEERLAVELARVAIALGADVNASDARGNTTLHHAVRQRFEPVITLLAEAGADLNVSNDRDETPLNLAEGFRPVQDAPEDITHQTIASLLRQLSAR